MDLTAAELLACMAVVALGGFVQGSVGFGINLMAAPVIALVAPDAVPGAVVLLSLPMTVTMAIREHHHVDRTGATWFSVGRIPGTFVGLAVVAFAPDDDVTTAVGVVILLAVALSLVHPKISVTPRTASAAGLTAGVTGTVAAVDGPPLALLYQHAPAHVVRPTFAVCFVIGTLMSAAALALAGEITADQLVFTIALLPAMIIGLAASSVVAPRLHGRSLRPFVLIFAAVAGAAAVIRGVW